MSHREHLIAPQSLLARPDIIPVDCRFNLAEPAWGAIAYGEGHLPNARFADLDRDLSGPIGPQTGRHPLPAPSVLAKILGDWGLDRDTSVAVYDDMGGAFAVRLWWLLRWLGHHRVVVLDGGLQAWIEAGGELTTRIPTITPRHFEPNPRHGAWITTDALVDELAAQTIQVIDARAAIRFRGESEPIDPVAGHIPGAINLPLQDNLDDQGRFLPAHQLEARFLGALGNRSPNEVAHSCGSGVNACHNLLAMEIAGLNGSRLYAGGWSEWIRSPQRPVAKGL